MTDAISPISPTLSSPAERLFPTLKPARITRVAARGRVRSIREGEVLAEAGERWLCCYPDDAFVEY
jgi:hypothetical protein